jgi:isopentenyl-diphosphate delta-isomerase
MSAVSEVVSSDSEQLILVSSEDVTIGTMPKRDCHLHGGTLHRAFSIFIFNKAGDVLLQQRSSQKMLWPGYWSNACCSHPREGEDAEEAAHRRLQQELGISSTLTFLYKFEYMADFEEIGTEHELCWVWTGFAEENEVTPNKNEVADWRFFSREELDHELETNPDIYTPWMKMEWERIFADHAEHVIP